MPTKLLGAALISLGLLVLHPSTFVASELPKSGVVNPQLAAGATEPNSGVVRLPKGEEKPTVYPPVAPTVRSPIEGNLPTQPPWTEDQPVKVRPDLKRSDGTQK